jgi:hypothetical protein
VRNCCGLLRWQNSLFCAAFKAFIIRLLFKAALAVPGAQKIVAEKNQKMIKDLEAKLYGHLDLPKFTALPSNGLSYEEVINLCQYVLFGT